MANYVSAIDIANRLGISKNTVVKRFAKMDIEPLNLNHKLYFLKSDIEVIKDAKRPVNHITPNERFAILEYFFSHRDNRASDLQKVFFIPQSRIDRIISEFFKNDFCVIAPSKLNKWK
jgi:DNA-binding MarR family transcriptional regulator